MARPRGRRRSREGTALRARLHEISAGLAVGVALLKGHIEKEPAAGDMYLGRALDVFRTSLADVRTVAGSVELPRLRNLDLERSLRDETHRLGVQLSLDKIGDESWLADVEFELIQLLGREALRNVARHSGSTRCEVTLDLADCPPFFRVRDWGAGLGEAALGVGGLAILGELAQSVGWVLEVRSLPGLGTELLVVGRACPSVNGHAGRSGRLRSVVADEALSSRRTGARRRPIGDQRQQIS